jgi:hypothetical protein
MSTSKYTGFKIKLERDLREIENQNQGLKAELTLYMRDQERLVPRSFSDIDDFLSHNLGDPNLSELSERREQLQRKCDAIFETICLLTALSVFATESTPEDIDNTLTEMGFTVYVERVPILDWDAVARIVGSMFFLLVLVNAAYFLFSYSFSMNTLMPNRPSVVRFALLFTVVYSAIIIIAIKLKRKWHRADDPDPDRPENLIIGLISYAASVIAFSIPFSIYLRGLSGGITIAPFLYAINQGVLGYFIGVYVDRSLKHQGISFVVPLWQGALQLAVILIATIVAPLPNLGPQNELYASVFSAAQSFLSGFLIGVLFQYFDQRRDKKERKERLAVEPLRVDQAVGANVKDGGFKDSHDGRPEGSAAPAAVMLARELTEGARVSSVAR